MLQAQFTDTKPQKGFADYPTNVFILEDGEACARLQSIGHPIINRQECLSLSRRSAVVAILHICHSHVEKHILEGVCQCASDPCCSLCVSQETEGASADPEIS